MRKLSLSLGVAVLLSACCALAAEEKALDLRRGVPADVFLAVQGKHNPERDFQRKYYAEVWKTVEETQIIERVVKIATARIPQDDLKKAEAVLKEIKDAAAPIRVEALLNCQEVVYAQRMQTPAGEMKLPPVSQHLLLLRLTPQAAEQTQQGIKNLLRLVEKYSEGKVPVRSTTEGGAVIESLAIPKEIPFSPVVIRVQDVLLVSSSEQFARQSLGMLLGGEGQSKFDDPRLKDALGRLPAPEDSLAFYDGKQQFAKLREIGEFVRQAGQGNAKAARAGELLEMLFDELAVFDYEVTVEYTEGNLNRTAAYGKLVPGAENKLLGKILAGGKSFENWQAWVPAEATSYSLTTGANLHPLYERIVAVIQEKFPEAQPGLKKFQQLQTELGVDLDRDLLQAFSGESVSVTLPAAADSKFGGGTVMAMRCQKPDRIRELLHRLVDWVKEQPPVKSQQVQLTKVADLDGFEELSVNALATFGVKPVIGFRDDWMFIGSNAAAIQKVLDTRAGKSPSVAGTKAFKQFNLAIEGPVSSIGYSNLADSTRRAAAMLNQAGAMLPMAFGFAGAQANPDAMKTVQDVAGLLPSVSKIVSKFDFLEARLTVTQAGDEPGSYRRRSAIVVRPASSR